MEFHKVVHRRRSHLLGGPRGSDLDEPISRTVSEGTERLSSRCGDGAAQLNGIGARVGERLHEPTPADIVEHRVDDEVWLDPSPDEHDGSKCALPLLDAVGIVEKDEAAGHWIVVIEGRLDGEGESEGCEALRSRSFIDTELGTNPRRAYAGRSLGEGIGMSCH